MATAIVDMARPVVVPPQSVIQARKVPGHLRLGFLPRCFGHAYASRAEALVYDWMRRLSSTYHSGCWEYFELTNDGFYLALDASGLAVRDAKLHIWVRCGNDFEGDLTYDASGIVATLYAMSHLIWQGAEHLATPYDRLRDFASQHTESELILAAIR